MIAGSDIDNMKNASMHADKEPSEVTRDLAGKSLLVAICTYNERENLPVLIDAIQKAVPDADLLVVDDGSPDGTGQWAIEQAATNKSLHVIERGGKLGLGSAIVAAMRHAIEHGYRYMVNLDGDLSHDPAAIPRLIQEAESRQADIVIGSRYVAGGAIEGWSWFRKLISFGLNRVARYGLGLKARDCSGAFRCYRVSTLQSIDLSDVRASGYAMLEEILWLLSVHDIEVVEIPITFVNRTHGNSKLNMAEAFRSLRTIVRLAVTRPKR